MKKDIEKEPVEEPQDGDVTEQDGKTAPQEEGMNLNEEEQEGGSDLLVRLNELEEENSELKDRLLRKQADYENFRKRMNKDKDDSIKYANQMLLLDIVETIDNFERAIKSSEASKDFTTFHDGIVMIEKQLVSMLDSKWHLKRFESEGEPFDPEKHLAIAAEEREDVDTPTVIDDYQRGYLFHDRILRPAKVRVAQPAAAGDAGDSNNKDEN